jgi:hypothetical protein
MRRTTPRGLAALAMLAIGAGQLLAPAAQAGLKPDNGTSFQGQSLQGVGLQGVGLQGGDPSGREAEAVDLGALALRAVRLPDGRVLPVARE